MKTVRDFYFKNKTALIRVDFNVPLNNQLEVLDATRIRAAKPTITSILEQGGRCVLMTHLGRPKGVESKYSLKHIVNTIQEVLGKEVLFANDCIGDEAQKKVQELQSGQVLLLENLRFYKEETAGDSHFAEQLSQLGDLYVNDAFGTAHRAHASTTIIAQFFPHRKCFGLLMAKEIESVNKVLKNSISPMLAIIGGAKVSSKITIISNILDKIDYLIIGGGMAFTFIKALGGQIGSSLVEEDKLDTALSILELAKAKGVQVHLPTDVIAADAFANQAKTKMLSIKRIPDGWMGLDIGENTRNEIDKVVALCKTILWNGPLGVFEMSNFSNGTIALGEAIAKATKNGAFSLVGGGDSVAAVKQFGFEDQVSYVSTGGGALLESLEGKRLPGVEAIMS